MLNRRDLLRSSAFLSLAPVVPGFVARTAAASPAERDGRVLVVLQLDGGNDGINTVVPFKDEGYAKWRRELRLPTDRLCTIGDGIGLHPSLRAAADLFESGRLAIVQGVSYPNPSRSHFQSMAIWQTARPRPADPASLGWLGRALDSSEGASAVHVGDQNLPRALFARRAVSTSFADASDLTLTLKPMRATVEPRPTPESSGESLAAFVARSVTGAYATVAELEDAAARPADPSSRYPETELARRLDLVSRSIKGGAPARVYYVIHSGYDSHAVQLPTHARLLRELGGALRAFLDDLAASRLADRVLVLAFSEFGRRPEENGSLGTDHGTAGPVFLAGRAVAGGLHGTSPRLDELEGGDLKWSIDFRRIYASILERWLNVPPPPILGGRFDPLPLIRG